MCFSFMSFDFIIKKLHLKLLLFYNKKNLGHSLIFSKKLPSIRNKILNEKKKLTFPFHFLFIKFGEIKLKMAESLSTNFFKKVKKSNFLCKINFKLKQ
jgi:hypothetical protein